MSNDGRVSDSRPLAPSGVACYLTSTHFTGHTMQTKSQIVAEVAARIANKGLSVSEIRHSYDAVMGEGAYEKLASDLYDAFRAEGTK